MRYLNTGRLELSKFILVVQTVHKALRLMEDGTRSGFFFALYGSRFCNVILKGMIGKVRDFKLPKYEHLVEEKAGRLFINTIHRSSHESRNTDEEKYGGAVRGRNYILSISGFATEHEDEAVAMVALITLGEMSERVATDIAEITGNKIFGRLLKLYRSASIPEIGQRGKR